MNARTLALAVAGAAIGVLLGAFALLGPVSWPTGYFTSKSGKPAIGGAFSLIDKDGKRVADKDFRGRYMFVFFGYTNCPDVCPAGLQLTTAALDKLGKRADDVVPVFITLDPERDTPSVMGAYAKSFHPRLVALTGSQAEIAAVAKSYRVFFQKVPDEADPKKYTLDHSAIFYLMGKDGTLVAPIPYTNDVDQLAAAIGNVIS